MNNTKFHLNYEIVIIGQQPWDVEIGSNCKNIALEFSKNYKVLYVNSPLDRATLYRERKNPRVEKRRAVINRQESGLVKVHENLWNLYPDCLLESINWIKSDFLFDLANRYNNYRFAISIKKALKQLGFNHIILFNDNEMFKGFYLKEFLKPAMSIYYSRDNMIAVPYWKRHGLIVEPQIIRKYDLCVANSNFMTEYCKQFNDHSYNIGQGCDFKFFTPYSEYNPLGHQQGRPIISYVGALENSRLDQEIIAYIAASRPDWTIVLVGPEDVGFQSGILHSYANIIFTGILPMEKLADYVRVSDVCINPQLLNEITIGNYPRKIDEYLYMGKPVVASATKAMDAFKDFVYLAETKEEYVELIELAIQEDNSERQHSRTAFAATHTWENSVNEIYNAMEEVNMLTN